MVQSQAQDVAACLAELPPERRAVVAAVRDVGKEQGGLPAGGSRSQTRTKTTDRP